MRLYERVRIRTKSLFLDMREYFDGELIAFHRGILGCTWGIVKCDDGKFRSIEISGLRSIEEE